MLTIEYVIYDAKILAYWYTRFDSNEYLYRYEHYVLAITPQVRSEGFLYTKNKSRQGISISYDD